jgi:hypothetical protein
MVLVAALLLAGCASMINGSSSEVNIATRPDGAHCRLSGGDGFTADITTPARLEIPHKAAPVTVTCDAPGFRRTVNTLNAGGSGWLWGNSALIAVTGGAAVLGLLVDEAMGATTSYGSDFSMDLDHGRERQLRATQRNGGPSLDLKTP